MEQKTYMRNIKRNIHISTT